MTEEVKIDQEDKPKKKKVGIISNIAFIIFIVLVYNKWKGSDSVEKKFKTANNEFLIKLNKALKRSAVIRKNHINKNLKEYETHYAMMTVYAERVDICKIAPSYNGKKKEFISYGNSLNKLCQSYTKSSELLNSKKMNEYLKHLIVESEITKEFMDNYNKLKN